LDLNYAYSK
jgi:hypothetical protein